MLFRSGDTTISGADIKREDKLAGRSIIWISLEHSLCANSKGTDLWSWERAVIYIHRYRPGSPEPSEATRMLGGPGREANHN